METEDSSSLPASVVGDTGTIPDGYHENTTTGMEINIEKVVAENAHHLTHSSEMLISTALVETGTSIISAMHTENGSVNLQGEISLRKHKKYVDDLCGCEVDSDTFSGFKRPRMTMDVPQPSVRVIYNSLNKDSKQRLGELLQQWSQWHAHNCSSTSDSKISLESGEETYFPALRVDLDKPSAVTFWIDNQVNNQSSKESTLLDGTSIPLYDRKYSLALSTADVSRSLNGGMEELDNSRCFNCGSYSHELRDCTKPRDNIAVNDARKRHKSKRNQKIRSRDSSRYYQSSGGGKYGGLMPGVLDSETRKLLGLREFDPPPWLNRMREIGYPPGYLERNEEDQPSGITIFGDEAIEGETEDGEILGASLTEPSVKMNETSERMSVEFPGLNAPIPEEADERLWEPCYSSLNVPGVYSMARHIQSSEDLNRESSHHRRSWEYDDDGPPGCERGTSPSMSNYFHRYADRHSSYNSLSPQMSPSINWSATFGRSFSERGRSHPVREDSPSPNYGQHHAFPYSSPNFFK